MALAQQNPSEILIVMPQLTPEESKVSPSQLVNLNENIIAINKEGDEIHAKNADVRAASEAQELININNALDGKETATKTIDQSIQKEITPEESYYQKAEKNISDFLKVDPNDDSATATAKRSLAVALATARGTALFVEEAVTAPGDLIAAGANLYVNSVESMLDRVVSAEKYAAQHFLSGLNALSNDALAENYGWVQNVLNDKHETDTQIGSTLNSALNTAYNVTSTVSNLDTNKMLSGLNAGWEGTKKGIDSGFNKLGNWAVEYKANAGNAYSSANFVDLSKNAKDVIDIASILVPVAVLAKGKMVAKAFDYKIKPISIKDLKHADQWGAENFSAWIDELPKKEKQAIIDYTGNGYIGINDYLRGKIDITHVDLEKISDISTALEKAVLPHDIKVFRGVNIDALNSIISKSETISGKVDLNNIIGKSLNETGFMSTSVLEKASFNYKQVIMEIHAPKGTNGAYLDHISQVPGEAEILFNKGQVMLIKDATLNGDNQIKLLLEIIKDK